MPHTALLSGSWIQSGDLDAYGEAALGGVGEDDASERGDVAEVAAPGGDDVAGVCEVVVGRVDVDPARSRREDGHPGVGGVGAGGLIVTGRANVCVVSCRNATLMVTFRPYLGDVSTR